MVDINSLLGCKVVSATSNHIAVLKIFKYSRALSHRSTALIICKKIR